MLDRKKIGTFSCWLFGHNFTGWFYDNENFGSRQTKRAVDYCSRCGISRKELKNEE